MHGLRSGCPGIAVWSLLLALAAGCDAGNVAVEPDPLPPPGQWEANPRPVTVAVGPLTATLSAVGDTLRLTARVADQYGDGPRSVVRGSVRRGGGGFGRLGDGPAQRDGGRDGHGGRCVGLGNRDGGAGGGGRRPHPPVVAYGRLEVEPLGCCPIWRESIRRMAQVGNELGSAGLPTSFRVVRSSGEVGRKG